MFSPIATLRRLNRRRSRLFAALVNSPVAFGLLIIALLAGGWNYLGAESSRDRVAEANAVLIETERLFSSIKDLDSAEHGFVLIGGDKYFRAYQTARAALDTSLSELGHSIHGDLSGSLTGQRSMAMLVAEKRDFAARVVATRQQQGFDEAAELVRTEEGTDVMEALRLEADAIRNLLTHRVERIQRSDRLRGAVLALLTGVASWSAAALLAGLVLVRRDEAQRTSALLEGVFENAPLGLGFLDRSCTLCHMNPPFAALGRLSAARGGSLWSAAPAWQDSLAQPIDDALREGRTTSNVFVEDGARALVFCVFPVKVPADEDGTQIEGVGLVVDDRNRTCRD